MLISESSLKTIKFKTSDNYSMSYSSTLINPKDLKIEYIYLKKNRELFGQYVDQFTYDMSKKTIHLNCRADELRTEPEDLQIDRMNAISNSDLYSLKADCTDAPLGLIKDFIFNPYTFQIKYLAVKIKMKNKRYVEYISVNWIDQFDWEEQKCLLSLNYKSLMNGPVFPLNTSIDEVVETQIQKMVNNVNFSIPQYSQTDGTTGGAW